MLQQANLISLWIISQLGYSVIAQNAKPRL